MSNGTDLAEIFRAEWPRLVNHAARFTRTRADAEDAVQDAFVVALAEMEQVAPRNPRAWLTAVTRHRALQQRTRATPAGDAIDHTPQVDTTPDTNAGWCLGDVDTALYVSAVLDELTPRQREALALWAIEGLSWEQVAERMGITQAGARRTGYEALRRLRG